MPIFSSGQSPAPSMPFALVPAHYAHVTNLTTTPTHGMMTQWQHALPGAQDFVTSTPVNTLSYDQSSSPCPANFVGTQQTGMASDQSSPSPTVFAPFQLPGPLHAMDPAVFAELQEIANDPDAGNSGDEDGNWGAAQESLCDCNLIEENDFYIDPVDGGHSTSDQKEASTCQCRWSDSHSELTGQQCGWPTYSSDSSDPTGATNTLHSREGESASVGKHSAEELEVPDSSGDEEENQMKLKRTKKNGLRLTELTMGRHELTEGSFPIFLQLILRRDPWMQCAPAKLVAVEAFNARQDYMIAHCDYQGKAEATEYEVDLIVQWEVQHHGELKTLACRWVGSSSNGVFRFCPPLKDEDKEANRKLVAMLKENSTFVFKDPRDISLPKSLFCSVLIQGVLNDEYFSNGIRSLGLWEGFFPNNEIPLTVIALIAMVIECAIDEWRSGIHTKLKFGAEVYQQVYEDQLGVLQDWENYGKKSGSLATQKLQQDMFAIGRAHASVADMENEPTTPVTAPFFTDSIFAADEEIGKVVRDANEDVDQGSKDGEH